MSSSPRTIDLGPIASSQRDRNVGGALLAVFAALWLAVRRPFVPRSRGALRPPLGLAAAVVVAHNEESVIESTIRSLLGTFDERDVYVFADGCSDRTVKIARLHLPDTNVIDHVQNIGKSRGLEFILKNRIFPAGYEFVSVIDADSTIAPTYMRECLRVFRSPGVAAVVGKVLSSAYPRNVYSIYRAYLYFLWEEVVKRIGSIVNAVTVASGTSTTWRVSALRQLTFDHALSTEDFGLTFQLHRRHLGKVKYASSAVVQSEDPGNLQSLLRQSYRWSRAWWESVRKYRVGLQWIQFHHGYPTLSAVDILVAAIVVGTMGFWFRILSLPLLLIHPVDLDFEFLFPSTRHGVLVHMVFQYSLLLAPYAIVALLSRRFRIVLFWPTLLLLALLDFIISLRALMSVARRLYRPGARGPGGSAWVSPGRLATKEPGS